MTKEDMQLTDQLINRAKSGKHSKFEFIRSRQELLAVKNYMNAAYKISKQFNTISNKTFNHYLDTLKNSKAQVSILLTAKHCATFADYYAEEVKLAKDMSREYYAYVFNGHILDNLLGVYRKEEDLVDYRTNNSGGFY